MSSTHQGAGSRVVRISIIAAMANNRVIGKHNKLPWHLPADLKHFRNLTLGKPIVMGRRTFQSIGRPLPGRDNIIVTNDRDFGAEGCRVAHSIDEALEAGRNASEVMFIGGATLYTQILPRAQRLYLTLVHATFDGDARFPDFDESQWQEIARTEHAPDKNNAHAISFVSLERLAI